MELDLSFNEALDHVYEMGEIMKKLWTLDTKVNIRPRDLKWYYRWYYPVIGNKKQEPRIFFTGKFGRWTHSIELKIIPNKIYAELKINIQKVKHVNIKLSGYTVLNSLNNQKTTIYGPSIL